MHKYVIRRLLLAVPVLLLSSLIVFGLMRVMPGAALVALMGESGNVGQKRRNRRNRFCRFCRAGQPPFAYQSTAVS